jgi:hypothetical protein
MAHVVSAVSIQPATTDRVSTLRLSQKLQAKSVIASIFDEFKMAQYTQLRWSKLFAEKAADLLTVILHRCGIQRNFETTMSCIKVKHWIHM